MLLLKPSVCRFSLGVRGGLGLCVPAWVTYPLSPEVTVAVSKPVYDLYTDSSA